MPRTVDIILQGNFNDVVNNIAEHYAKLEFVNSVIISHHTDDLIYRAIDPKIVYVSSDKPDSEGNGNENYQITTTLSGLLASDASYVVKMRNDQMYTLDSMRLMHEFYNDHMAIDSNLGPRNTICVAGNFASLPFHPRDHIYWGNRKDLIDLFSLPLCEMDLYSRIGDKELADVIRKKNMEWIFYEHPPYSGFVMPLMRTEIRIALHYIARYDKSANKMLSNPKDFIHDGSPRFNEAINLSNAIVPKFFKSFPRNGIELSWPKLGWATYPYDQQYHQYGERWSEDGY